MGRQPAAPPRKRARASDLRAGSLIHADEDAVVMGGCDFCRLLLDSIAQSKVPVILTGAGELGTPRAGGAKRDGPLLELEAHLAQRGVRKIHLTPRELSLLKRLASDAGNAVPPRELVLAIWGRDSSKGAHSIRGLIKSLRYKIEPDPTQPRYLLTEPSTGYRLRLPLLVRLI